MLSLSFPRFELMVQHFCFLEIKFSFCEFALKIYIFLVEGCDNFTMIKDGVCNVETNNKECNYDGGDCCGYDCNGPDCKCYHQGNLFWGIYSCPFPAQK